MGDKPVKIQPPTSLDKVGFWLASSHEVSKDEWWEDHLPCKQHSYSGLIEVVVHCATAFRGSQWHLPVGASETKTQHEIKVLECPIFHDRRSEMLHPVSGAVLQALSHGYSVLFHGGDSSSRAPLAWLAVLRHCFGFEPSVGMQLLRNERWKLDQALQACADPAVGAEPRAAAEPGAAVECKVAEALRWVAGLKVLLAEGGFHPFKALSHGEEAPLVVYKALSQDLLEFTQLGLVNGNEDHLFWRRQTGPELLAQMLKEIDDETRLSPWYHCSKDFCRAAHFRQRRVEQRKPKEPGSIVARLNLGKFCKDQGLSDAPGAEPRERQRWTAAQKEPMTAGQFADLSSDAEQNSVLAGHSSHERIQKRLSLMGRAANDKEVLVAWRCQVGPEYWDVCCEDTGRYVMSMVDWLSLPKRPRLASE